MTDEYNIRLAHYNSDEVWRLNRLAGIFKDLDERQLKMIHRLRDHKGNLQIEWNHTPEKEDMLVVLSAWQNVDEEEVQHFIRDNYSGRWDEFFNLDPRCRRY